MNRRRKLNNVFRMVSNPIVGALADVTNVVLKNNPLLRMIKNRNASKEENDPKRGGRYMKIDEIMDKMKQNMIYQCWRTDISEEDKLKRSNEVLRKLIPPNPGDVINYYRKGNGDKYD